MRTIVSNVWAASRVGLLAMALCSGLAAASTVTYDLRDRELVLMAGDAIWQVTSATLGPANLRVDLHGRSARAGQPATFGITSASHVLTYQDGDSSWALERIEGLPVDEAVLAESATVSLHFAAPRHIFSGLQLELVSSDGETHQLPMSLPGAIQARREFDAAEAEYRAQRWNRAAIHYRAAAAERPNHVAIWRGLGRVLVRLRQNPEAVIALGHALGAEPEQAYDQALLGFALLDVSTEPASAARALEHLRKASALGYDWAELGYFIGYASELTGDVAAARSAYLDYVQVGTSPAHVERARVYLAANPHSPVPGVPAVSEKAEPDEAETLEPEPAIAEPADAEPADPEPADSEPADPAPAVAEGAGEPAATEIEPEPEPEPARPVVPERPVMADADHVAFPIAGVADFGIERVVLESIFLGSDSWILRVRSETFHEIGPGTHLLGNRGDRQRLLGLDAAGDLLDLTFGVPAGKGRTVTLQLVDPESGTQGDCTFAVPGYDRFKELTRDGNRALADANSAAAVAAYSGAITYRAGDATVWWRRGISYQRMGESSRARFDFEKAAELAPENGDIQALLGQTLLAEGEAEAALAALQKAATLGADSPATLLDLGDAHAAVGDPDSARSVYQSILDRFPGGSVSQAAQERLSKLGN